jgi:hypothetical protein
LGYSIGWFLHHAVHSTLEDITNLSCSFFGSSVNIKFIINFPEYGMVAVFARVVVRTTEGKKLLQHSRNSSGLIIIIG